MATGERKDPYAAFNFMVDIDGMKAVFSECSGLSTDTDPIEYRTGEADNTVTKIPGLKKFANISLKRGMTQDLALWEWRKTVLDGLTERKSGSITLLNEAREEGRPVQEKSREGAVHVDAQGARREGTFIPVRQLERAQPAQAEPSAKGEYETHPERNPGEAARRHGRFLKPDHQRGRQAIHASAWRCGSCDGMLTPVPP